MLTESANTSGAAPVPPSPPSIVTRSTPRPVSAISRTSSCQNARSPTADLIPTGSPVSAASISTQSSIPSTSENSACRDGLTQSTPCGTPRVAAISAETFAAGQHPAEPGLGPLAELDLQRTHRCRGHRVLERARSNRPCSSRQPK